jgi:hypothetical protein
VLKQYPAVVFVYFDLVLSFVLWTMMVTGAVVKVMADEIVVIALAVISYLRTTLSGQRLLHLQNSSNTIFAKY